jgi:hypothetical protein
MVGATYLTYEFENQDPPGAGGLSLRAPSSDGWWDASRQPATTWPWRGGASLGHPGEEVAIIEGADEGGVLIRKGGGFAYFDSDGEATPLPDDFEWLAKGASSLFASGWDTARGPDPAVVQRLGREVPLRTTIEAKVTEVEQLDAEASRRWRLGSLSEFEFRSAVQHLKIKAKHGDLSTEERGALLADAITDPKAFDAKARKAMIPFGKSTVGAFKQRFVLGDSSTLTRCTVDLTFRAKHPEHYSLLAPLIVRVLLDAGVSFPDMDADAVRFVPAHLLGSNPKRFAADEMSRILACVPTVEALERVSGTPPTAQLQFTLAADVQHSLEVGQTWNSSAIEPLSTVA